MFFQTLAPKKQYAAAPKRKKSVRSLKRTDKSNTDNKNNAPKAKSILLYI